MDAASGAWAASGAMALTGRRDGPPLVAPDAVVERMQALGRAGGVDLDVDVLALLGQRAAIAGFRRDGATSCGGSTRLLRASDGWLAVSLARPSDVELLPAWLERDADSWDAVDAAVRGLPADVLVDRASLLGMPVAGVGRPGRRQGAQPVDAVRVGEAPPHSAPPVVVDLSSLWAGPLCARLLHRGGARVIKVESWGRPDGGRRGPPAFFDVLHAGHESVALDFSEEGDRQRLRDLLTAADMVIEASRPRALAQLGLPAESFADDGPAVWISITGYGRNGAAAQRVAFGDDAAAAGGLVALDEHGPCFVADAVADPLTGVAAAATATAAWKAGGRWILDVAMAGVAAHVAGGDTFARPWREGRDADAAPPRPPAPCGPAPALGAHTAAVLREFGLS